MRDAEVVAGFLRIEEAEMLIELLASAGVDAWPEGVVGGPLGPLIPGAGGGAKLLVRSADAARARELIAASGVFGPAADPAAQVPEEGPTPERPTRLQQFPIYPVVVIALVLAATAAVFLWHL
jgi:hypothetical protein